MDFLEHAPRNLFFTGKGGVGKTSVACATALAFAERGRRVLLVSTTEEIAVFRAFARVVDEGEGGFVVIDTAPTGHTLLLLDAAESYHREVLRTSGGAPEEVRRLLPRLRDPSFTKILLVTLPEATPVHEAASLQRDLERAGIRPFAWGVNQSLMPLAVNDPTLVRRRANEARFHAEVRELASRAALVPWSTAGRGTRLDLVTPPAATIAAPSV